MEDVTTVEGLDSLLESASEGGAAELEAPTDAEGTQDTEQQPTAEEQQPAEQDQSYYTPEEKEQIKANKAYASLRVENTTLKNAVAQFAKQNGYNGNPNDIRSLASYMQQLQAPTPVPQPQPQQPQAAQQQPSPETSQYEQVINSLRQRNLQLETDQITFLARQGFSQLQQEFNLSSEDIEVVAEQFAERGLDPYADPTINIVDQFKLINYDKVVERAAQEKANEILERERAAAKQSTSPLNVVSGAGKENMDAGDIKTVADLERFFESYEKGR